jgi:hypothetical protein
MKAIISTVNTAYDLQESRPWWKVRGAAAERLHQTRAAG